MSGAEQPRRRSAVFRVHTPSGCLIAWSVVSGSLAATLLLLTVNSLLDYGWDYGMHGTAGFLVMTMTLATAVAVPWVVQLSSRDIRWVRVTADAGLQLSDGRAIEWNRVYDVDHRDRVVVVHVASSDPIELRGVRDAPRLVALIDRYAGGGSVSS